MAESARRRRVEARIVSLLESAGFAEVILPILDYADADTTPSDTYRFVDRDGELVAVRSDFTPMVARALAPSIASEHLPLRVFYRGDVIRYEVSRLGANRETFQIGGEIVGDASVQADIEAMTLVSSILRDFGVTPLIVFTDATIADQIGDREAFLSNEQLRALPALREISTRLEAIENAVGADCVLRLDDIDRAPGYYTGLRFRAYDATSRRTIARGGRYDTLYGKFGTPAPAVGFTLTIDDLD